jgi:transposase
MMGRLERDQGQLFCSFCLEEVVPDDHQVRAIAAVLDLSWVYGELSPHYPALGRPSVDPVLMIRMLILGYAFGLRSERLLCREVKVNLAYRWFCGLSIEDKIPDHSAFSRARNAAAWAMLRAGAGDDAGLRPHGAPARCRANSAKRPQRLEGRAF